MDVATHAHAARLLERARGDGPLRTAVVWPHDDVSLAGALLARRAGLIEPVLLGEPGGLEALAAATGASLDGVDCVPCADAHEAAERAVLEARAGRAGAIMKGALHSDELLHPVMRTEGGLRGRRRLSHVFVMDVPGLENLLLVTDAAINIAPTLEDKIDIVQNAIDLAHALGIETPRVGILSAVEIVNPRIPSTLDAAVLSKMAERGQITGGLVDGPLAMDNALNAEAARSKGIRSLVAGRADVLVAPNLEAGNILAKELAFVSGALGAGIVVGATVPIMLTSRADSEASRLVSCAVALLLRRWQCR